MANECMLSTIDNPFDPFEQFTQWLLFDKEKGYNCCERLARIAHVNDEMTEKEVDEEVESAIDEIIKYDFTDTYIKVIKNSSNDEEDITNT